MNAGTKVRLKTFNGSVTPPSDCKNAENYWALIGYSGTVLKFNPLLNRYLVQFDCSVPELGLHCHNPEPNSLYIQDVDLAPMRE